MKVLSSLIAAAIMTASSSAFAFITRLDIVDVKGGQPARSVVAADQVSLPELDGKLVTYMGRGTEAKLLLQRIVDQMGPGHTDKVVELNEETQTISIRYVPADMLTGTIYQVIVTKAGD